MEERLKIYKKIWYQSPFLIATGIAFLCILWNALLEALIWIAVLIPLILEIFIALELPYSEYFWYPIEEKITAKLRIIRFCAFIPFEILACRIAYSMEFLHYENGFSNWFLVF